MARDNTALGRRFQALQSLGAREPGRVISGQPALRNPITPVFNDMAMITDEQESATVGHINLHADQTY